MLEVFYQERRYTSKTETTDLEARFPGLAQAPLILAASFADNFLTPPHTPSPAPRPPTPRFGQSD